MFRLGLWLKMRFIAMPMVSGSGILVKKATYIVGKDKFFVKICIPNLRNKSSDLRLLRNER